MESKLERLEKRIMPVTESGCWMWLGYKNHKGYGVVAYGGRKNPKKFLTHRVMYEIYKGKIPTGLQIDHLCKVRCCVNPAHLEAVTLQENVRRSDVGKPQRERTHCKFGHPFDEKNTYVCKGGKARGCKTCKYDWGRRNYSMRRLNTAAR